MLSDWLRSDRFLWSFIIGANIFRFLFVPTMGLMPQGAYYFVYSEHLDWSYYDHPPMVAYMLFLFATVFGKAAWVVKLSAWTVTLGSQLLFYKLASLILDREKALLALAIFVSTTMLSILSLVVTPDIPLIFTWTLSMIILHEAIFKEKWWAWILGGLAMGLAFDSKYTAVFLPGCLLFFLLISNTHRKKLLTIWPYLSVVMMVVAMLPVIYWNVIHEFASFSFQGANRAQVIADEGWKPTHILGSIANQSVVLVPVLFFAFIIRVPGDLFRNYKELLSDDRQLFALAFFLPVFGSFMALSFIYWVKLNWIMPAYVAGCIYAVRILKGGWLKWQFILSVLLHVMLALQVWMYVFPVKSDDTWYGWDQLASEVEIMADELDAFVIGGDHYKTTAELSFYMDKKVYAHNTLGKHSVQYDIIDQEFDHLIGKDALYIDSDPSMKYVPGQWDYPDEVVDHFRTVTELRPIRIYKGDQLVRIFRVLHCQDYTGLLPEDERDLY